MRGRVGQLGRIGRLGLTFPTPVAGFNPASLFAGGGLGFVFDPSPANTGVAVDAAVAQINDTSGNGNHATQATAGSRPLLRQSGSLYYIELDGTDDFMTLPTALLTGWSEGTGIFATKRPVDPPPVSYGPVLGDFGSDALANHYPFQDGNVYEDFLSTARKSCGDPGDCAAWHVGDFRSGANNFKASYNGTDYFSTATNTVGVGSAPLLGKESQTAAIYIGFIGRVIVINRVLTGADLANARTWVGAGSGITL